MCAFLGDRRLASSGLAITELSRALALYGTAAVEQGLTFLDRTEQIPVSREVLESAGQLPPPLLRSLDAIHLASALLLGQECEGLVTYDARMQAAARILGLRVAAPEQSP